MAMIKEQYSQLSRQAKSSKRFKQKETPENKLIKISENSLKSIDPRSLPATFMYVSISGMIQSGTVIYI